LHFLNGSICLDGLSIPLFSLGKTAISLTNKRTLLPVSRSPDMLIGIRRASTLDAKLSVSPKETDYCSETLEVASMVAEPSRGAHIISERLMAIVFKRRGDQPAAARTTPLPQ